MTFFKVVVSLLLGLCLMTGDLSAQETDVKEISCSVDFKKDTYKEKKPIKFNFSCMHPEEEIINLPEQFFTFNYILAHGLRFKNAEGIEYCLMDRRYSTDKKFYRYIMHKSGKLIQRFTYPDKRADRFKVVLCDKRDELKSHDVLKREDLYSRSANYIPQGEYEVSVKMSHEWQTIRMGYHNLIVNEKSSRKADGEPVKWKITDAPDVKSVLIK